MPLWTPLGALAIIAAIALAVMLARERRALLRVESELHEVREQLAARAKAADLLAEALHQDNNDAPHASADPPERRVDPPPTSARPRRLPRHRRR